MSTLVTIASSDVIANSRTDINNNFSALNTDKIETSVLDTDTTLAANSDSKVATQKATKAYVDASVNPTGRSWNEYAADSVGSDSYAITVSGVTAYVTGMTFKFKAGTANTGACSLNVNGLGAKTIKKEVSSDLVTGDILTNQLVQVIYDGTNMQLQSEVSGLAKTADLPSQNYTVGALSNSLVKTYFSTQLLFNLWTGAVVNDTTTTFVNWRRSSTDVNVTPGGAFINLINTGADSIDLEVIGSSGAFIQFDATNIIILDWWAKLPASGTGDIQMGFFVAAGANGAEGTYNNSTDSRVCFGQSAAGSLYSTICKNGASVTNTDISSGLTLTNWNNYRIELDLSNNALFYVNGVLKATMSGANFPNTTSQIFIGFGRSNTSLFRTTAPNLSLQMNP